MSQEATTENKAAVPGSHKIANLRREQMKAALPFDAVSVGDSVKVHTLVFEGGKSRTQIFAGIVIGKHGQGVSQAYTVRKISYGEGVERVFPIHSPRVEAVEVVKRGKVRRAKLNYLRDRVGKEATTVKEMPREAK